MAKKLRLVHSCSCKATEKETAELGRAIGVWEGIAVAVRKIMEEVETPEAYDNLKRTLLVELSIKGLDESILGVPNRTFVKEGSLRISKSKLHYQLYLFTDVLIIAEKSLQHSKLVHMVYPDELKLADGTGNRITLKISDKGIATSLQFTFKSSKEVLEWKNPLEEFIDRYTKNRVFGISINDVIEKENLPEGLPFALFIVMKYIREYGMYTEGIFRVPGDQFVINTFKRVFDSGAIEVDFRGCSVHDVAALLKLYLRELPEPLIPFAQYNTLIVAQRHKDANLNLYNSSLAGVITELPENNRRILKELLNFLKDLSKNSNVTMMDVSNLALVIAPNVIRPQIDTVDTAMQSAIVGQVFEYLIDNFESIYKAAEPTHRPSDYEKRKLGHGDRRHRYSLEAFNPLNWEDSTEMPELELLESTSRRLPRRKKSKKNLAVKHSPRFNDEHVTIIDETAAASSTDLLENEFVPYPEEEDDEDDAGPGLNLNMAFEEQVASKRKHLTKQKKTKNLKVASNTSADTSPTKYLRSMLSPRNARAVKTKSRDFKTSSKDYKGTSVAKELKAPQ